MNPLRNTRQITIEYYEPRIVKKNGKEEKIMKWIQYPCRINRAIPNDHRMVPSLHI